jgi:hypothetical protein
MDMRGANQTLSTWLTRSGEMGWQGCMEPVDATWKIRR